MHFKDIQRVPGDPILGLIEAYAVDPNPNKFDLGVGVYKDAMGLTPVLRSVKLAEQRLLDNQTTKTYIGGHGQARFGALLCELVMGKNSSLIAQNRVGATQAPGGTGALRLCADFIAHSLPGRGIWLSDPTWPIHESIFGAAGLKVSHYPYVGSDNRLHVEAMLATLKQVPHGDVVLLHACCHNPTGFDLSHDDWRKVLEVVRSRNLLPLIDFAYQGFGDGLEQDAWPCVCSPKPCQSCSSPVPARRISACTASAPAPCWSAPTTLKSCLMYAASCPPRRATCGRTHRIMVQPSLPRSSAIPS